MTWISVEDRLPRAGIEVLLFNPNRRDMFGTGYWVDRADFREGQYWIYRGSCGGTKRIVPTHWQPLPEPPK